MDSHTCNSSGAPSTKPRRGRRLIAQLERQREGRIEPRNGLARADQYVCLGTTPSAAKGLVSHNCYTFSVEKGNRKPTEGPEKGFIGSKIYYLGRGKSREAPCGAIDQAVLPPGSGHRVW